MTPLLALMPLMVQASATEAILPNGGTYRMEVTSRELVIPGGAKHVWNPGHAEMEASFVPKGAKFPPPLSEVPLSGIVLTATAIEFTNL